MMGMRFPLRKRLDLRLQQRLPRLGIVSSRIRCMNERLCTSSNEISVVRIEEFKRVFCRRGDKLISVSLISAHLALVSCLVIDEQL